MTRDQCTVTFNPDGTTIGVDKGTTVLSAAIAAGVFINSVCGGKGACKRCKVSIDGAYAADESFLNEAEKRAGAVLACKATVEGDCVITVPESSRTGIHQLMTESAAVDIDTLAPAVRIITVTMPAPTLSDNISDVERIQRALLAGHNISAVITSLDLYRTISATLRTHAWSVAVTLVPLNGCEGTYEIIAIEAPESAAMLGIAVDIGTTTVVAQLLDLATGAIIGTQSDYNGQIVCGEDVIARISYEEENTEGLQHLRNLIIQTINRLIKKLVADNAVHADDIKKVVLSGNTVMTHLVLGMPTTSIKYEPYVPSVNLVAPHKAQEFGLTAHPEAYVYCVPGRSAYVGGDVTSDIIAAQVHTSDSMCLLIDVGTNGEVVLGNKDMIVSCSCSAGPAFEGGEVKHGMRAAHGAIEEVVIGDTCTVHYKTIGEVKPRGICGSGLIDLIAELFVHGIVDKAGKLQSDCPRVRATDEGNEFLVAPADEMEEAVAREKGDITILQSDIDNIIRTKGAIYAGCAVLLKSLGMDYDAIDTIFIAGGFGNYIDVNKAIILGLLPDVPVEKFSFIGNGSLAGARAIALSDAKRVEAEAVFKMMTYLELSVSNEFFNEFTSALFLPHTDIGQFPTVRQQLAEKNRK